MKFVDSHPFSTKKFWSPITARNLDEVEARFIWAETKAKYEEGMVIHFDDIPLQEGALRNGLKEVVIDDGKTSYTVSNLDDLKNTIIQNKRELADKIAAEKRNGWGMNAGSGAGQNLDTITSEEIARAIAGRTPGWARAGICR